MSSNSSESTSGRDPYPMVLAEAVALGKLQALGFTTIKAEYQGSDDSGSIEGCVALKDPEDDTWSTAKGQLKIASEEQEIWDLFYRILEHYHGGWEINDGSSGEITLDLATKNLTLEHRMRVIEYVPSTAEVELIPSQ